MSTRTRKEPEAVVEEEDVDLAPTEPEEEFTPLTEGGKDHYTVQEFNEHIQALVQNFVQQEISGLEERIRDLEMVVGRFVPPDLVKREIPAIGEVPEYLRDPVEETIPDYVQEHQSDRDGIPWYRG